MRIYFLLLIFIFTFFTGCQGNAGNFFKPGQVWYDNHHVPINAHGGGVVFYGGKYYWFGQHNLEGEKGNSAWVGVHAYSSDDLYHWTDEGIVLKVENDSSGDIAAGCILERPKVIVNEKTGKFIMWFHLEKRNHGYGDALCGLAASDYITGPYQYLRSERPDKGVWPVNVMPFLKTRKFTGQHIHFTGGDDLPVPVDSLNILGRDFENGQMARDMNLFKEDDGKAYHIYTSEENSTIHISMLSDDYLGHSGVFARVFAGRYMEGAAMFKDKGKYYFIASGCTGWNPNAARWAVADSIFGPWTEMGNPCMGEDSALTFHAQSTCIFPVQGKKDAFIFMADRWTPENAIDGRYVWLPVIFRHGKIELRWMDEWDLGFFDRN